MVFGWEAAFLQAQETPAGDAREVVASGMGSITGGDVAHARDDAIEDALRTAIEQTLGTLVESETLVDNFQLIEDRIFSKTQGFIQKYEVVKEGKRDAMLYEVTVKAVVKVSDLKNDLAGIATLMRRKNLPRTMMMIEERNIGEAPGLFHYFEADMNTAETAIMEAFMAKGFRFVDRATVLKNLDRQEAAAISEGDMSQAAALGRSVGAEIVITGKALAKATEIEAFGAKQRSQQATVTVKVIRTDTGDIIATSSGQGAFPHIDDVVGGTKAIQRACEKMTEPLITQILDRWSSEVSSGTMITLRIKGVTDYNRLNKIKSSLKYYVRGASDIVQRDWSNGWATLELTLKGSGEDLAQRIDGKDMEGYKLKVIGMSENSVTAEVVETAPAAVPEE
jgi:hypothetical protein